MLGYPYYGMHGGWRRRPSRLLWFAIGAFSAAWWIKRHDADRRLFGNCKRPPLPAPEYPEDTSLKSAPPSPQPPQPQHRPPLPSASLGASSWESYTWDQERQHLAKISQQAAEAMTDLSEATLETVLTTAEALKAKIAEIRAERQRQQKILDERLEAERKNPPRFV